MERLIFKLNKKHISIIGMMALSLGLFSPAVFAEGKCQFAGWGKSGKGGFSDMFFTKAYWALKSQKELGLSDEQVKAIQDLKISVKKDTIQRKADLEAVKLDIQSQLKSGAPDKAAVHALIDQKYELKKANTKAMADAHFKLKETLNAEQLNALKELKKDKKYWKKKRE